VTFAAVGALTQQGSSSTFTLVASGVGNLIVAEVINMSNSTVFPTALSSSNVTWATAGTSLAGVTNPMTAQVFFGKVTSASSATVTISWSGTAPASLGTVAQEFSSTLGSWTLDGQGHIDIANTSTWASLTPTAGAGELYFGFAENSANANPGTTSGYTYVVTTAGANGVAYNPACTSAAQAPTWTDNSQQFGIMVLVKEGGGAGPPVLPQPGSRQWRARFRRRQTPQWPLPTPAAAAVVTPFVPPQTLKGRPAAVKGRLASSAGETGQPGEPAPFRPPRGLLKGAAAAVRGRLAAARGRSGQPAPFTPPHVLLHGPPAPAPKGKLSGRRGLAGQPSPFTPPRVQLRGASAARKGTSGGLTAPPPVLHPVITSPFTLPPYPLRGPAAARKGALAGVVAPPPVAQPSVPAPFFPPRVLLRGPQPVKARTMLTGKPAPPPPPPPAQVPRWQGATHMVAGSETGNLIQGSMHTGAGGPSDIKGDFEQGGN
jgi:hypothetical protein